jgi:peptide-N4-(N-acetyl-beta-glucosaminyl)asparagine amidase
MYEQESLKRKALSLIPIVNLRKIALSKFDSYEKSIASNSQPTVSERSQESLFDLNDFILVELLAWFKNDFFKWIDKPDCSKCNSNSQVRFIRSSTPTSEEIAGLANNIEVYEYV